ncbi:hypothetical protein Syun_029556 [Stephania yunnanensis]|uniref:Uncharacterized protein n=1 Tax=Stephania yunnanensis TaxID=152371 RepID=A0AAP0HJL4_9MAGN
MASKPEQKVVRESEYKIWSIGSPVKLGLYFVVQSFTGSDVVTNLLFAWSATWLICAHRHKLDVISLEFALPLSSLTCSFFLSQSCSLFLLFSMSSSVHTVDEEQRTESLRDVVYRFLCIATPRDKLVVKFKALVIVNWS